jgi:hypothetical protein
VKRDVRDQGRVVGNPFPGITSPLRVIQAGNQIDVVQLRSRRGDDCYSSMAATHNEQSHVVA